jgi:hypothetical protein
MTRVVALICAGAVGAIAVMSIGATASAQTFNKITPPPVGFNTCVGNTPGSCIDSPQADTKDLDPAIAKAADLLGLVRTTNLSVGQLNILEYNAQGTMTDWETPGAKPGHVDNYTLNVSFTDNASRLTFQGPNTPMTIRVVKGSRAWDESWTAKNTLATKPADASVAIRRIMMWLDPHAVITAAAFAAHGQCADGTTCSQPKPTVTTANGQTVISVTIEGNLYKVTLGPDARPAKVETTANGHTYSASYFGYRNGTSLGQEALDKMHNGTYWPSRVTQSIDGMNVLDVIVTAGWSDPYTAYPTPEQLATEQ